ncbi:MAG: hypothetical protein HYZ28_04930 [Myxococcales bacterium]|nr:hypothetical protein [Myxococcales bacterium]
MPLLHVRWGVPTLTPMKEWGWVGVVALLCSGCATVKVTQRNGCWVRQTETFPKTIREDIGPCVRQPPAWSADRVTRLVQECIAEADYRWQAGALAAWQSGLPLPRRESEEAQLKECLERPAIVAVAENEALKKQLGELSAEREHLRRVAQEDREHWKASQERMAEALGEAAKKPAPSAFATANSTGTATSESDRAGGLQRAQAAEAEPKKRLAPKRSCEPGRSASGAGLPRCDPPSRLGNEK